MFSISPKSSLRVDIGRIDDNLDLICFEGDVALRRFPILLFLGGAVGPTSNFWSIFGVEVHFDSLSDCFREGGVPLWFKISSNMYPYRLIRTAIARDLSKLFCLSVTISDP